MLDLHRAFYSPRNQASFIHRIEISEPDRTYAVEARALIRDRLKQQLPAELSKTILSQPVTPRFFTQGSFAYKTINSPARPTQQMDIDDGTYLPLGYLSAEKRPSVASQIFFESAEKVLGGLSRERNWLLVTSKPTCIRIEISKTAHVDVPLYAIPDGDFTTLQKSAMARAQHERLDSLSFSESEFEDEDIWDNLPSNSVLLAHREEDWKQSDPRPIKKWFLDAVEEHGEQFRRIVRFLKAFRDHQWHAGGPSSILLMVASESCFGTRENRDDLALLDCLQRLPNVLRGEVRNPKDDGEILTARLSRGEAEEAAQKLEQLEVSLRLAVHDEDPANALARLASQFGRRFPTAPALVTQATVAQAVSASPVVAQPSRLVGRTQAG